MTKFTALISFVSIKSFPCALYASAPKLPWVKSSMQTVKLGIINGPVPHSRTLEFQIAWRAWLGLVPIAPADHGFAAQLTPENMSVPHCRILVLANVSAQVLACFVPWSRKLALARRNMAGACNPHAPFGQTRSHERSHGLVRGPFGSRRAGLFVRFGGHSNCGILTFGFLWNGLSVLARIFAFTWDVVPGWYKAAPLALGTPTRSTYFRSMVFSGQTCRVNRKYTQLHAHN